MTTYLFDSDDGFRYSDLASWREAELLAKHEGWELLGERQTLPWHLQTTEILGELDG